LRNFELEGLKVFVDVKMKTLTPALSHPMGEGDRIIASKKDDAAGFKPGFPCPLSHRMGEGRGEAFHFHIHKHF
jgi:hypothetical protein